MKTLIYNELNPRKIPNFTKVRDALERGDFQSAEVKKIGDNLYRARLDRSNRLLFSFYCYQAETYCLLLEWIEHHAYNKSRFIQRGVTINEDKIPVIKSENDIKADGLIFLNAAHNSFNLLDKIISFDEIQQDIYNLFPPLVVIGSAGSGKTALTLEKMKQASGEILYITRSPFLVHNSRTLYYAMDYTNDAQEISFLSFDDYLASIQVPEGKELTFNPFFQWFSKYRLGKTLCDPYQVYEEFKGVLTGAVESAYLSHEKYLNLGVKQSIFHPNERNKVYDLFKKYLAFMCENNYYDANILSYEYLELVDPRYDFIVIDEVQDLTTVQLQLIMKALHDKHQFIMCGDSNQIVHPNFFSWAKIKSLFYQQKDTNGSAELIRILNTNYRNSPEVTEVANRILKLKTARFGSVDRESNYLVKSNADKHGTVILLHQDAKMLIELNQKTSQSIRFAVIVMHPEHKALAKKEFDTPLIFSIQEAKGLEYENIILFNFISAEEQRFSDITRGIRCEDLDGDNLHYARAKDKTDKSLEIYKFHINALYVAITRAVKNIYLVEKNSAQPLFNLLELQVSQTGLDLEAYKSNLDEWRNEANRLEMQGKEEQADEIRKQILKLQQVPWEPITLDKSVELQQCAIGKNDKKAKLLLFEYALVYHHRGYLNDLVNANFKPAKKPESSITILNQKYYTVYGAKHTHGIIRLINQYGVDFYNVFNQTPLMIASRLANHQAITDLMEAGANPNLVNNAGFNAYQIALEQACIDEKYCRNKLESIYKLLEPDNCTVQSDGRLYQLDNRLMEFLLLNIMMAMFYSRLGDKIILDQAFSSADFVDALNNFPDSIVPERRKKRSYISSILSKNEVHRDGKYNRRIFYRIKRGHYIINPQLSVRINKEWLPIYELLQLDMMSFSHTDKTYYGFGQHIVDNNKIYNNILDRFKSNLQKLSENAPKSQL